MLAGSSDLMATPVLLSMLSTGYRLNVCALLPTQNRMPPSVLNEAIPVNRYDRTSHGVANSMTIPAQMTATFRREANPPCPKASSHRGAIATNGASVDLVISA